MVKDGEDSHGLQMTNLKDLSKPFKMRETLRYRAF